jgi:hypothetical protein
MNREILAAILAISLVACGGKRPTVAATASAIMGPSTALPSSALSSDIQVAAAPLTEGTFWRLSPNKAKVTFTGIDFTVDGIGTSGDLTGCSGLYDRTRSSGAQLFQCPIQVPIGKITALTVRYSASIDVLINDTNNGIYTDPSKPTGFATTPPTPGPQFATLTLPNPGNSNPNEYPVQIFLTSPITVAADSTPNLYIVVDMVHSFWAKVTNGALAITSEAGIFPPAQVYASFSRSARSEFYTTVGTAENVSMGNSTSETYVRLNYLSANEAGHVWTGYVGGCMFGNFPSEAWNISPALAPNGGNGMKAGGYLGLDASNTLAWALPVDFTWSGYRALFEMPRATATGSSVNLKCQLQSTVPIPADGNTYASGVPPMPDPTTNVSLTLVAN